MTGTAGTVSRTSPCPACFANLTREVVENSAAGTAVGEPVTGTPHGTETLSYSLTGEAAISGAFVINSATGQISVKSDATLDHETKSSYTGKVKWTVNGQDAEVDLTINVTDDLPHSADFTKYFLDGENATFAQSDFPFSPDEDNDALGHVKFTSRVSVPYGQGLFLDLPNRGGFFSLKKSDGTLSAEYIAPDQLIAASDLDKLVFVPSNTFDGSDTAEFKVVDQDGDESGSSYTLTLNRVANFPPSFGAGPLSREVPENSPSGTAVGAVVTATDPDAGDTLTYSLSGTDASSFSIDSSTGQISVASGTTLDRETKNGYQVEVGVSDSKDSNGNADTVVDATITVNIAVTNVFEGPPPPSVTFSLSEVKSTKMKVTVTPPDTTGLMPIKHYTVAWKAGSTFNILASPAQYDGSVTLESGTTETTLTGLTPSTTYHVKVVATNVDEQTGAEPTAQTATTDANTAPDSADFTKEVSRQTGATFSASDFPFTDPEPGDTLAKVKIVTLPGTDRDSNNKRKGELRFDGTAVTTGQEVSANDLGKLKYVPHPDGKRLDFSSSFTFKVLDGDGEESPTYTATLKQIADIVLTLSPDAIGESVTPSSGGRITVNVTVTGTLTGPVRTTNAVIPQIKVDTDYDARENSDYKVKANSKGLTIPAGQKSASVTFEFNGIPDFLVEGDELIRIYAAWIINYGTFTPTEWVEPVYLTLRDNDFAWISAGGPTGPVEEGEDAVFSVKLSGRGIAVPATVAWSASTGTASEDDFALSSGTVTFPGGSPANAMRTIAIPVSDDLLPEVRETFFVTLGEITSKAASNLHLSDYQERGRAFIAQSDPVTVSVPGDERVMEGDSATYTISLDSALSTEPIRVYYDTRDYTAVAGTDYTLTHGTASIAAGQTSATVTVPTTENTVDDAIVEGGETIVVNGSGTVQLHGIDVDLLIRPDTIDLTDNDTATVGITGPSAEVAEGSNAEFTVTLSKAIAKETTVAWSAPLSTDTATADDLDDTSGTVTFAAGSAAGATETISIGITDDTMVEAAETFTVTLGAVGGDLSDLVTVDSAASSATATISAASGLPSITLSVDPEYIQEGENAAEVVVTATRDGTVGDHTVTLSVGGGTATNGTDYTIWTFNPAMRIAPGDSSATKTLTFTVTADGVDEGNETVILSGTASGATVSDAVVTIGNAESITLSVDPSSISEGASATEVTVTATLSETRAADTSVSITLGGTTADPADYTATSLASITIPKGQTSANGTLTINPVDDTDVEGNETITVSGQSGARTVSPADITITDNEGPVISFETAPESVTEGSDATYVVKLEGSRTTDVTVKFKTGAPGDLATAGADYTAVDSTITFTPTDNTKTVTVNTTADTKFEVPEDFTVTLSNAQGGGGTTPVISDGTKTTTINDDFTDDPAYPDSYTVTANPTTVGEGDGATQITFTATIVGDKRFASNEVNVVVYLSSGTAEDKDDYTISGRHVVLTIPANGASGSGTLTLTPVDDSFVEDDETIVFTSAAGGGMTTSTDTTVTLTDNDAASSITLSVSPSVLREGKSDTVTDVTVTATLDGGATLPGATDVAVSLADGTADSDDYSKATVTVTIPAGVSSGSGSFKATVKGDDKVEDDETLNVTGTAAGFTVHPAEITILDDDSGRSGIKPTVSPSHRAGGTDGEFGDDHVDGRRQEHERPRGRG